MPFTRRSDVNRPLNYAEADANWSELERVYDRSLAASEAAMSQPIIYGSTTAGIAGTASGDYFVVPDGVTKELVYYLNNAGVAVEKARTGYRLPFEGGTLSGALNHAPAATLASAATVAIGGTTSNAITITGTTTITGFDAVASGAIRVLTFAGSLTLTRNATSLILPGGVNIQTAAGDVAVMKSLGGGNWRCINYLTADGRKLIIPPATLASAATVNIGSVAAECVTITGTTTITSFGTALAGTIRVLTFAAALTITHNSASLILPGGGNILTGAGDVLVMQSLGGSDWRCVSLVKLAPQSFITSAQTITLAGTLTIAHGLAGVPRYTDQWIECVTTNLGYSVGHRIPIAHGALAAVRSDATNIILRYSSTAPSIPHWTTGVQTAITVGSWRLLVRVTL